jgi:UDP-glucose 4-epimerase
LIIGCNGFLARSVARRPDAEKFRFISHGDIDNEGVFNDVTSLINLAVDPRYMTLPYDEVFDFELQVGKQIADRNIHYVMASSRKVYSPDSLLNATEKSPTIGVDEYGRSKRITEVALSKILGRNLTIFRLANVTGFDDQWDRQTFMARMLSSLRSDRRITLDINPSAQRDFITDDAAVEAMVQSATKRIGGCFNLGSGIGLGIGQLAEWIIDGFGSGEIVSTSDEIRDEFILNVTHLNKYFSVLCTQNCITKKCFDAGRNLKSV